MFTDTDGWDVAIIPAPREHGYACHRGNRVHGVRYMWRYADTDTFAQMNDALAARTPSFVVNYEESIAIDNEKIFDELGMIMLPAQGTRIVVNEAELQDRFSGQPREDPSAAIPNRVNVTGWE